MFGSRAKRDFLEESDYDITIVSKAFEGIPLLKRLGMLYELWGYKLKADILAYTPKEFELKKREIGIVKEAVKTGIEIY
ncbi:MAG: nucleotidyltransferase domain-containing protein [Candidatus Bathyarchaeia archaeon]